MSGRTGISWCDTTWNPIRGCSRVSEGCRNCYAEEMAGRIVRMGKGKPTPYDGLVRVVHSKGPPDEDGVELDITEARWTGHVAFDATKLAEPLRWRKPQRIFVNSMSDLFHEQLTNEQIAAVFGAMAACPQHTFLVLTKRAKRMREWFEWSNPLGLAILARIKSGGYPDPPRKMIENSAMSELNYVVETFPTRGLDNAWPLPNVWIGVSVEDQDAVDERIPDLLATPAEVRWLSCEPLLGPVDIATYLSCNDPCAVPCGESTEVIDWVVAGCESGRNARPCNVEWLRSLRGQCREAEVPFFLKQAVAQKDHRDSWVIADRSGSRRKPGGIIELPYLDGVQHAELPKGDAS